MNLSGRCLAVVLIVVMCSTIGVFKARADFALPNGTLFGPHAGYDYGPSVIFEGNIQQFWWCG